jgi:hypothetical protein
MSAAVVRRAMQSPLPAPKRALWPNKAGAVAELGCYSPAHSSKRKLTLRACQLAVTLRAVPTEVWPGRQTKVQPKHRRS